MSGTLYDKIIRAAVLGNKIVNRYYNFLNRKPSELPQEYNIILSEFNAVRNEINEYIILNREPAGVYWWNVPIEDVVDVIAQNREREYEGYGGWRFEENIQRERDGSSCFIYLKKEGHNSSFSNMGTERTYNKVSQYSESEQEDMVRSLNKRIDRWELMDIISTEGRVYSPQYGKTYDSALHYYTSFEHIIDRKINSDFYANSLYDIKETKRMRVYSNSSHYVACYEIAGFEVDDCGTVEKIDFGDSKRIAASGDIDSISDSEMDDKNAALMCAIHFAVSDDIKRVPARLFGNKFIGEASSYYSALYSAAIFLSLADKIDCDGLTEPQYEIKTEDEFNKCKNLVAKYVSGEEMTEAELIIVLDIVNKHLLPFDREQTAQLKVSVLFMLSAIQHNINAQLFYVKACAYIASAAEKIFSPLYFIQMEVQSMAVAADILLGMNERKDAAKYAQHAIAACDRLEQLDPSNDVLDIKRDAEKMLKRANKKGFVGLFRR